MKAFSVRVPAGVAVSSEEAAAWLDQFHTVPGMALPTDPGAGSETLRLSLDESLVEKAAKLSGDVPAVFLRRLLAAHREVTPETETEPQTEAESTGRVIKLPEPLLKGRFAVQADQMRPLVRVVDAVTCRSLAQLYKCPEAASVAQFTPAQIDTLSEAGAKVLNNRAPQWFLDHADLIVFLGAYCDAAYSASQRAAEFVRQHRAKEAAKQPAEESKSAQTGMTAERGEGERYGLSLG